MICKERHSKSHLVILTPDAYRIDWRNPTNTALRYISFYLRVTCCFLCVGKCCPRYWNNRDTNQFSRRFCPSLGWVKMIIRVPDAFICFASGIFNIAFFGIDSKWPILEISTGSDSEKHVLDYSINRWDRQTFVAENCRARPLDHHTMCFA